MELQKCSLCEPTQRSLGAKPRLFVGTSWRWRLWISGIFGFWFFLDSTDNQTKIKKSTLHKHCFALVSERAAWLVQMVWIHSWRTVRIQTLLSSITITSEMGKYWFEPLVMTPVYFQHPNSNGFELPSPAHIFLLSSPIIHETSSAKLSHSRGALMKSTSLSERVWKNNGGTEIITSPQCPRI